VNAEERQALREKHKPDYDATGWACYAECRGTYPCDTIKLLDATEPECDHFDKFIGIMIPQSSEVGQVCESAKFPFCPKCGEKL
jgi:hypothetical protein